MLLKRKDIIRKNSYINISTRLLQNESFIKNEYNEAKNDKIKFWYNKSKDIEWFKSPTLDNVLDSSKNPFYTWFPNSLINMCYNCVDKHVNNGNGNNIAIIQDSPVTSTINKMTYNDLLDNVKRFAGVLKEHGISKGDKVMIYMPNIPEAAISMLACSRIGAIHCVVFGGFAPNELASRINDTLPKIIITCSGSIDGKKLIPYQPLVEKALEITNRRHLTKCIVYERKSLPIKNTLQKNDYDWDLSMKNVKPVNDCIPVESQHPLYILHTSGSTGTPKGVVRDTGGYAVAMKYSMNYVFDSNPGEVFWAASDIGWVVGHSYIIYGPLIHGLSTVMYEGKPVGTPDESNFWRTIERHRVNKMFTAPTALRAIKKIDSDGLTPQNFDLSSLKGLFLAGERADPDTLHWGENALKHPLLDNFWQTETGWPMCSNHIGLTIKYGSAGRAVPGFDIHIVDNAGQPLGKNKLGTIAVKLPMPPGFMSTLHNSDSKFISSYMTKYIGYYDTGDEGKIDDDNYVYIMSRTDDVINVAGHRLSCGAIEEILSDHHDVAECAVIGIKDILKGQVPLGLIVLNQNNKHSEEEITNNLIDEVRNKIGAICCLKKIVIVERLPKTRSGKILRKTLRSIANHESYTIPPTIEDPDSLKEIEAIIKKNEEK